MPELPEVQTIVSDLAPLIENKEIKGFSTKWSRAIKHFSSEYFSHFIVGKKIKKISRFGKNIFITLSNNAILLIHLRMTGKLLYFPSETSAKLSNHAHHIFLFSDNSILVFDDVRKFGTIEILSLENFKTKFKNAGFDPINDSISSKDFFALLNKSPNTSIKQFLLNQDRISGIGNIYASEILFHAKINPLKKCGEISQFQTNNLLSAMKFILKKAIKLRGTTFSDYRDSQNKKGGFQKALMVYKKDGQPCKKCGNMITRINIGQRSTFYCSYCQSK